MKNPIDDILTRVRQGNTGESDATELEKLLLNDSMIPTLRNRLAYEHHIANHENSGVHCHLDLNSFGLLNKKYGDHQGDRVIKEAGKIIGEVGKRHGARVFRTGGDEFKLWFFQPHHAENFIKEVDKAFKASPHAPGGHAISAAIGLGHSRNLAEQAMIDAKGQLKTVNPDGSTTRFHEVGKEPTVAVTYMNAKAPDGWKDAESALRDLLGYK